MTSVSVFPKYVCLALLACGLLSACVQGDRDGQAPQAHLVVSGVAPAAGAIAPGSSAVFIIDVVNSGPDEATGVRIIHKIGDQSRLESTRCRASGGATCPPVDGSPTTMAMKSLPAGGALRFTDTLRRVGTAPGFMIDSMAVSAANDADPGHDTVALAVPVR